MIYYISDTHFGDERIMKLSKRPFSDVDEMNKVLIKKWNDKVSACDDVYIVGDFAFNNKSANDALDSLNGRLHLIIDNHDELTEETLKRFSTVNQILTIDDCGRSVCLCHYPLLSYENSIYGASIYLVIFITILRILLVKSLKTYDTYIIAELM